MCNHLAPQAALLLLLGVGGLALAFFLGSHLLLAARNVTTYESFEWAHVRRLVAQLQARRVPRWGHLAF